MLTSLVEGFNAIMMSGRTNASVQSLIAGIIPFNHFTVRLQMNQVCINAHKPAFQSLPGRCCAGLKFGYFFISAYAVDGKSLVELLKFLQISIAIMMVGLTVKHMPISNEM